MEKEDPKNLASDGTQKNTEENKEEEEEEINYPPDSGKPIAMLYV